MDMKTNFHHKKSWKYTRMSREHYVLFITLFLAAVAEGVCIQLTPMFEPLSSAADNKLIIEWQTVLRDMWTAERVCHLQIRMTRTTDKAE